MAVELPFPSHIDGYSFNEGLKSGELTQGQLNVTRQQPNTAYVIPSGAYFCPGELDEAHPRQDWIRIIDQTARNRAMNGDIVGVKVLDKSQWIVDPQKSEEPPKPVGEVIFVKRTECGSLRRHLAIIRSNRTTAVNQKIKENHMKRCSSVCEHSGRPAEPDDEFDTDLYIQWATDKSVKAISLDRTIPWFYIPMAHAREKLDVSEPMMDPEAVYEIQFEEWAATSSLPRGSIVKKTGNCGSVLVEEQVALMKAQCQKVSEPLSKEAEQEADQLVSEYISKFQQHIQGRVDLRDFHRIITIDPVTARDLDDAIHIKKCTYTPVPGDPKGMAAWDSRVLQSFNYLSIGVHIADVSHFVKVGGEIDKAACERFTTVYLPHKAFHMLPRRLCEEVCSLDVGKEDSENPADSGVKLTFSCEFALDYSGQLLDHIIPTKFYKSVMKNSYRLDYDQVQGVLDLHKQTPLPHIGTDPNGFQFESFLVKTVASHKKSNDEAPKEDMAEKEGKEETELDFLPVENPSYPREELVNDLLLLEDITQKIRQRRFDDGSMELTKVQLRFPMDGGITLDGESVAAPAVDSHGTSHELIEELMLIANKLVARKILQGPLGPLAVVRYHQMMDQAKLEKATELVSKWGIAPRFENGVAVTATLKEVYKKQGRRLGQVLEQFLIEGLNLAKYGVEFEIPDHFHFGLGFQEYTHFTSPIRRYPDIMVHRLLAATLLIEQRQTGMLANSMGDSGRMGDPTRMGDQMGEIHSPEVPDQLLLDGDAGCKHILGTVSEDVRALLVPDPQSCVSAKGVAERLSHLCEESNKMKEAAKKAGEEAAVAWLLMWLRSQSELKATVASVFKFDSKSVVVLIIELGIKRRIEYLSKGDPRLSRQLSKEQLKLLTLPERYVASSDEASLTIEWGEGISKTYELLDAIPVYVLPSREIPINVYVVPLHPKNPLYSKILRTQ